MKTILIAAKASNDVIGNLNTIPWNLPSDLQHFKRTTMGCPMIMGSKTWESFGCRALPGRHHIVISSKSLLQIREQDAERVHHVTSLDAAIKLGTFLASSLLDDPRLYVIGGAHVYEQAIGLVDELLITQIDRAYPGDRFFPVIHPYVWDLKDVEFPDAPEFPYRIMTYVRA